MEFERNYDTAVVNEACEFLNEMFPLMGFQASAEAEISDKTVVFNIVGPDAAAMIRDANGAIVPDLLSAIAWILKRARFSAATGFTFVVDADGYRSKRIQLLEDMAEDLSDYAHDGLVIDCYGMNAVDRRAVHFHLSKCQDVSTESEGQGIFRRLKIRSTEA